jgi:hypothetical protein
VPLQDRHKIDVGLAGCEHAELDEAPAVVASGALEIGKSGRLHAGHDKGILRKSVAADQRAATVRQQCVGQLEFVGLASASSHILEATGWMLIRCVYLGGSLMNQKNLLGRRLSLGWI